MGRSMQYNIRYALSGCKPIRPSHDPIETRLQYAITSATRRLLLFSFTFRPISTTGYTKRSSVYALVTISANGSFVLLSKCTLFIITVALIPFVHTYIFTYITHLLLLVVIIPPNKKKRSSLFGVFHIYNISNSMLYYCNDYMI
jgi:hypothetical protein